MSEKPHLSPFQTGVLAALTLVGTSLAVLDPSKRQHIKDAAEKIIKALPEDRGLSDGSSEHHLPLQALIAGLFPETSKKSAD